jgi:hypothetical protein
MRLLTVLIVALALLIVGCGGGGGGGGTTGGGMATAVGRVLNVETGGPMNPAASVQIGANSVLTSLQDGSFQLPAPTGSSSLTVDPLNAWGVFTFATVALSGTTDVGDLWVGPQRVTLRGRVLNSTNLQPVAGAQVTFAGRRGTTDAQGRFALTQVAYSNQTQTAFWGIVGSVRAAGFFRTDFTASPNTAIQGTVTVNDILITPTSDTEPPPPPFNVWGRVGPSADAPGTLVTLKQNGTAVRIYNVGSDTSYYFWVEPGTYTIEFVKGNLTAQSSVTLTAPNEVIRRDVTLQ